jgi:FixJ family two-component response regulator
MQEGNQVIAIVDDDESVREAMTSLLRSNRFKTETRRLLLDIGMPGIGGLELQRRLAGEGRRIPIIFITANDNQDIRMEAMRAGAVDFLSKPFSEEALLKAIRNALNTFPQ